MLFGEDLSLRQVFTSRITVYNLLLQCALKPRVVYQRNEVEKTRPTAVKRPPAI